MAKRRKGNHEEVMLIPFLDILCSLIGILVLIIVVLCVANTRQTQGRTPDEVARAGKFASLSKELKSLDKQIKDLESMKSKLESQQADADKKQKITVTTTDRWPEKHERLIHMADYLFEIDTGFAEMEEYGTVL